MSIKIGGYSFDGPYGLTSSLEKRSGVYAILCEGSRTTLVDVGESADVRDRVENHDRKTCWKRNCSSTIKYAAYYVSGQEQRSKIEQAVRNQYHPPCGKE
jgi:hypothetical protein